MSAKSNNQETGVTMLSEIYKVRQAILFALLYPVLMSTGYSLERSAQGQNKTDGISFSIGLEFDRGDYGTADITNNWRIPLSLNYYRGPFFAGISVPYISAQSSGVVTVSSGSRKRGTSITSATVSKVSGLGDVNLSAGYNFNSSSTDKTKYYVSAHIKLATADENKGLGTGEINYAIETGLNRAIEQSNLFASIGYQISGDTAVINYDNVFYVNVGVSYNNNKQKQPGVMLDYAQAATPGIKDSLELTWFMNYTRDKKRSLYFYVLAGLSESSPDYGAGVNYRIDY